MELRYYEYNDQEITRDPEWSLRLRVRKGMSKSRPYCVKNGRNREVRKEYVEGTRYREEGAIRFISKVTVVLTP